MGRLCFCTVVPHTETDILIYLLTAFGLSPGGSSTVHIYTQTVHRTTHITTQQLICGWYLTGGHSYT
jgi:hypothetical protein